MFNPEHATVRNARIFKIVILFACALSAMGDAVVTPALPAVKAHFGDMNNADLMVRLFLTMPALFMAISSPVVGYVIDRYGRKHYLLFSATLLAVAGGVGLITESFTVLLISRAFVGIGTAGTSAVMTALIGDFFDGQERANLYGAQSAAFGMGQTLMLLAAGMLADVAWNAPFWLYLYPVVLMPFMIGILREPTRDKSNLSAASVVQATPVLPLQMMIFTYGMGFIGQLIGFNMMAQMPFHLQSILGDEASAIGVVMTGNTIALILGAASAGWFNKQFNAPMITAVLLPILAAAAFVIASATTPTMIFAGLLLNGFALGVMIPALNTELVEVTHESQRGRILTGYTTAILLGQFCAPLVGQPIVASFGIPMLFAISSVVWMVLGVTIYVSRASIMRWTMRRHAVQTATA